MDIHASESLWCTITYILCGVLGKVGLWSFLIGYVVQATISLVTQGTDLFRKKGKYLASGFVECKEDACVSFDVR